MAMVRCYCNAHVMDTETALYVKDGRPLCHEYTCRRVRESIDRGQTPISVTVGNDPGDETRPNFYGRLRDDGSLVFVANRRRA